MNTPNLAMPELLQNQSSKEITHNQALRILDVLVPVPLVQDKDLNIPPSPIEGQLYIVGSDPTGAWENHASELAYSDGFAWWFITPKNQWVVYLLDEAKAYRYNGSNWVVQSAGDVGGSASSTDNAWPRFDGQSGKQLQNGQWVESDNGDVSAGGALTMNDNALIRPVIKDYAETAFSLGSISGNVVLDFEEGNLQYAVLTGDVTFSVVNPPASGQVGSMTLELKQDGVGGHNVIFPAAFQWSGGSASQLSSTPNATDILVFYTRDGGSTYYIGAFGLHFT